MKFNLKENQDRCIYRSYPSFNGKIEYGGIALQFFIYNRNYGWIHYKEQIYNLNKAEEAQRFIQVLKDEGFVLERNHQFTITDPNYKNFVCIPYHHFLFFMYYTKGDPLTEEECKKIDDKLLLNRH